MVRNVASQFVIAYRGRRSHQALRSDANLSAASLQKMARASQVAAEQTVANLGRIGERFVRLAQISAVIFGVGMVKDFFTAGAGFEKAMSGVRAVSQGTRADFRKLADQAKHLGATTVFTAGQSAEAMEKLALSGLQVNQIYGIMPAVLNLAAAGELDMADAATIAVGTLKGFALETEGLAKAIDVMAFTASNSNQTIRDIGVSFSFMGTVANQAGLRFNEVSAALAILANRNIRAERSGTALRRIITTLIGDVEEGSKGLAGYGLELTNADGTLIGLADAIDKVNASGANMRDVMDEMRQRAGPAFLAMVQAGGEAIRRFEFSLDRAGGTAKEVAEIRLDNLQGKITLLTSAWRNLAIEVFERVNPSLTALAVKARNIITEFSKGADRLDNLTATLVQITKAAIKLLSILLLFRVGRFFVVAWQGLKLLNFHVLAAGSGMLKLKNIALLLTKQLRAVHLVGVAGALAIGWEVGKLIGRYSGLDNKVRDIIERWRRNPEDMRAFAISLENSVELMDKLVEKAGQPIGFLEPDELRNISRVRELLRTFKDADSKGRTAVMKSVTEVLEKFAPTVDKAVSSYTRLGKEAKKFENGSKSILEIWEKAGRETTNQTDQINLANKLLDEQLEIDKEIGEQLERASKALEKIRENATKFVDTSLAEVQLFRPEALKNEQEAFKQFQRDVGKDMQLLQGFAGAASERILDFVEAHKKLGVPIPNELKKFIKLLEHYAREAERTKTHSEFVEESWERLESAAASSGLATKRALTDFSLFWTEVSSKAEENGETVEFALRAIAEELTALIDAANKAGQEIPENLAEIADQARMFASVDGLADKFQSELETMVERLREFGKEWKEQWKDYGMSIVTSIGDTTAKIIVDKENLQKSVGESLKSIAKQGISMLIQWGIQKLIWDKLTKTSIVTEHMANMAGYMGEVALSSFASAAAIPVWGWAAAPGIATQNVGIATGIAAGAMSTGAALGAGTGASLVAADGGIFNRRTDVTIGEAGPEGVFPLRGERARRAVKELGLGNESNVVNISMQFTGDNWVDNGVSDELSRRVAESIDEMIGLGQLISFRRRTI